MTKGVDKTQELLTMLKDACQQPYREYTVVQPTFQPYEGQNVAFARLPYVGSIRFEFIENNKKPYHIRGMYVRDPQISKDISARLPGTKKETPLSLELAVQTPAEAKEALSKIVELSKEVVESYLTAEGYIMKSDGTVTFGRSQ